MERLYELELQVEKIINILNNVIKFIQMNNLIEERENAFNIIKDNYQTLTTQDVDLLNFNFKKLARSVATIIHPDRFPQDEELGAKANEILQSFNGSIDSLNIQVKDALTHGQTTYLWHLNKTNKAEQEYQRAYDQEKKQYQEEYERIVEKLKEVAENGLNEMKIIDMSDKVRNRLEKEGLTVIHEYKLLFDRLMSYDTISW